MAQIIGKSDNLNYQKKLEECLNLKCILNISNKKYDTIPQCLKSKRL